MPPIIPHFTAEKRNHMLPKDPAILLSVVNTKLRDNYADLEDLCAAEDADRAALEQALAAMGCHYDAAHRQFV